MSFLPSDSDHRDRREPLWGHSPRLYGISSLGHGPRSIDRLAFVPSRGACDPPGVRCWAAAQWPRSSEPPPARRRRPRPPRRRMGSGLASADGGEAGARIACLHGDVIGIACLHGEVIGIAILHACKCCTLADRPVAARKSRVSACGLASCPWQSQTRSGRRRGLLLLRWGRDRSTSLTSSTFTCPDRM